MRRCTPPARSISNTVELGSDDLCRVLDAVIEAAPGNFMTIESEHGRDLGAFEIALKPHDADSATMYPCCRGRGTGA